MKNVFILLFTLLSLQLWADCPGLTVNLTTSHPLCNGDCNGKANASISGGSGNYNYFWQDASFNPVTGQALDSAYNLCAGDYYFIVQDIVNACFDTTAFTLVDPQPLVSTGMTNQHVTCFGGIDGSASAFASGGTPPYSYIWSNGSTTSFTPGLPAGSHFFIVTDSNGCQTSPFTVFVNQPQPIIINSSSSPSACGSCTGVITTNVSGGIPPYNYNWSPSLPPMPQHSSVCPGMYQVVVIDANGCLQAESVNVASGGGMVVTATSTGSSCSPCNGTISVNQSGGTAPYQYSIDNGLSFQGSPNFSGVCPGNYAIVVQDAAGCQGMYTLSLGSNGISGLIVSDSIQHASGSNTQDGFIDLTLSGASGPFTFSWSNGATSEDVYSLNPGNYSVTISNAAGDCEVFYFSVNNANGNGFITGHIYQDNNQNCVYDLGDTPISNYFVVASDGTNTIWGYTNASGYYSILVPAGNYTVDPFNATYLNSACSNTYAVNVTGNATLSNLNFYYAIPPVYDVCVSVWSQGIVPGFNGSYYINLNNPGTLTASGTVCLALPAPLNFVNSVPSGSISGDTICMPYSNLAPGASLTMIVNFYTPPTLPLGSLLTAWLDASISGGTDVNPSCNTQFYTRVATGSYDPNDKSVSPAGENQSGEITVDQDEFTYLIRFQNTGTGPAVNIIITDTLTPLLDMTTFEMLNASHAYDVELLSGNILRWKFNNIMLPDSGSNEPASHGHVQFRIKTLATPVVGQVIENIANIYFDFNEPVITNAASNLYIGYLSNGEELAESTLQVYPNPAGEWIRLQLPESSISTYALYDVSGRLITSSSAQGAVVISTSMLENGMYFIRSSNNGKISTAKFIVRH